MSLPACKENEGRDQSCVVRGGGERTDSSNGDFITVFVQIFVRHDFSTNEMLFKVTAVVCTVVSMSCRIVMVMWNGSRGVNRGREGRRGKNKKLTG